MLQQHPHHQDVLQSPCASGQTRYFAGPNGQLMAALPPAGYSTYDCYGTMQIPYQQDGSGHAGNMQYMGMHQPAQAPRLASSSYGRLPGSRPKARGSRLRKLAALLSNPVAYMPQNFTTMLPSAALYPQSGSLHMQHQQKYQAALDHGCREARAVQAAEQSTMHVQSRHSACRQGPLAQSTDRELHVDTNPLFPSIPRRKRSSPSRQLCPPSGAAGLAGWAAMSGGDRSIHLGLQPQGMQNSHLPGSKLMTARRGAHLNKRAIRASRERDSGDEDDARVLEPEEDKKELYNRLGQSEEAVADESGNSEGAMSPSTKVVKFEFDVEESDEEGCTAGYAGDRRMRKPKTHVSLQASLMPLLVSDAVEDEEQFIQVKGYCPYGFFEGRLRDVGNFRKRSESQV